MSSPQDAEKHVDKDIFRKGSPKKERKVRRVAEDPGPCRPTTAKSRAGRPSSAERNRNEQVKPSVWLDRISREGKEARSFIDCNAKSRAERPNSAERNRREPKSEKKKKKKRAVETNRPSSAERERGDTRINNAVWLEGKTDGSSQVERPSSAGKRRADLNQNQVQNQNNKQLDQNGRQRPGSAEKMRRDLPPLEGITPLKKPNPPKLAAEV